MSVISAGNSPLDSIRAGYTPYTAESEKKKDELGQEAFLTMLVAQLQHQDPLNPLDTTDFSSQLAQYSQLEQLITMNTKLDYMVGGSGSGGQGDAKSFIGHVVTGTVDTMSVNQGDVSTGFYNLGKAADVVVTITDASGRVVNTLYEGQQAGGSHLVAWDGTDANGASVPDGAYTYTVMADYGYGYTQVESTLTGTVDGVVTQNGKDYLIVQNLLLDPDMVTMVTGGGNTSGPNTSPDNGVGYLGTTVTGSFPFIRIEDGAVKGSELSFKLDTPEDVTIKIYDGNNQLVRTIEMPADQLEFGENGIFWDGTADSGFGVDDDLYYYTVEPESGGFASTAITDEVTGVRNINGNIFLELGASGRLLSISDITHVQS